MGGAARSTVLLANATGAQFADAAAIASDVMSLFKIKAEDMAMAVDGITSTTIASKFDINDYRLALAQAGGVAAMVGVEFTDFNAAIAAISPSFASGSDAGTSFKVFLQRLVPDTKPAIKAMRELGLFTGLSKEEFEDAQAEILKYQTQMIELDPTSKNFAERQAELTQKINVLKGSLQEGQNAFFNLDGSMKSMAEISGILNEATKGLTEEQKIQAFSTIFGTDAMRAAGAVAGMTEQQFNDLKATMAKTDAEESAAKRMDTFKGVMEILTGVVDTLKVQIGDAFLPTLRRLAELFTQQAQVHGPAIVEMFRGLAGQLEVSLQKFLPWVEKALPELIAQIPTVVANLVEFGMQFIEAAKMVYNAVGPVVSFVAGLMDLKGILLIVGGLMAVSAVASVVSFVASIVGAVSSVVGFVGAIGGVLGSLGGLGTALAGAGAAFTAILAAIGPVILIVGAVGAAIAALYLAWENNFLGIRDITQQGLDFMTGLFTDAVSFIRTGFFDKFTEWSGQVFERGKEILGQLGQGVSAVQEAVKTEVATTLKDIQEHGLSEGLGMFVGRMYERAREAVLSFVTGINEVAPNAKSDFEAMLTAISTAFDAWVTGVVQPFFEQSKAVVQRIADGLAAVVLSIGSGLSGITTSLSTWVAASLQPFFDQGQAVVQRIKDGLASVVLSISGGLSGITTSLSTWVTASLQPFFDQGQAVVQRIKDGIGAVTFDIRGRLETMITDLNNWVTEKTEHFKNQGKAVLGKIKEGLNDLLFSFGMRGRLETMIRDLDSWLSDKTEHFKNQGKAVLGKIKEGLNDLLFSFGIKSKLDPMINDLNSWVSEKTEQLKTQGRTVLGKIKDGIGDPLFDFGFKAKLDPIIGALNEWISQKIEHLKVKGKEIGQGIIDGIGAGITGGVQQLRDALTYLAGLLPQWVKDIS